MASAKVKTRKASFGGIAMQTLGAKPMYRFAASMPVGKTEDFDLVTALVLRGYDVRIEQPAEDRLARRVAKSKLEMARRKAAEGKVTP